MLRAKVKRCGVQRKVTFAGEKGQQLTAAVDCLTDQPTTAESVRLHHFAENFSLGIHSKSDKVCGLCFSVSKNLRKKCVNCDKEFGVNGAFF